MTVRWFVSDRDGRAEEISPGFVHPDAIRRLSTIRRPGIHDDDEWFDGKRYWIFISVDSPLVRDPVRPAFMPPVERRRHG